MSLNLKSLLSTLRAKAVAFYKAEPVRVNAAVTAGVVALVGALGLVVDSATVGQVVGAALVILVGGEASRAAVTPNG